MRGRTRGSDCSGFAITASELLRTRELLQRQRPSTPAVVLDMGGGTGVHAAWLAGRATYDAAGHG
jgi:methylase of polypeptide subunit release factors